MQQTMASGKVKAKRQGKKVFIQVRSRPLIGAKRLICKVEPKTDTDTFLFSKIYVVHFNETCTIKMFQLKSKFMEAILKSKARYFGINFY